MKILISLLIFISSVYGWNHAYTTYDELLKKNVDNGQVDYKALKNQPQQLTGFIDEIEKLSSQEYKGFSLKQKLAFWINSYNAYTVHLIVKHYPLKSIKDIGSPWDKKIATVLGESISLNHMEHKIIRKEFKEPRIHFALVCAAKSCPNLQPYAYTEDKLDTQLANAGNEFLKDATKNKINAKDDTIYLSKVFKWYGDDFEKAGTPIILYIQKNVGVSYKTKPDIKYMDYDWLLNSQ